MFQELLALLPKEAGTLALALAMTGTVIGAGLWLFGSRFSRSLITLLLVSLGAWLGLLLPRWYGWSIDGWITSIALALLLGASGFFLHRFWVGIGLGLVLAAWAAVIVWLVYHGENAWSMPHPDVASTPLSYATDLWQSLPIGVQKYLPFAAAIGLISGLASALLWPRFGVVLLYSTAGVSMLVTLGLSAMNSARPQWLASLPAKPSSQVITLLAMVAFGAILQWNIAPAKKGRLLNGGRPLVIHD